MNKMEWLEGHLDLERFRKIATRMCNKYRIGYLAEEVLAETLLLTCENIDNFNPRIATFNTWAIRYLRKVVFSMTCVSTHVRYGGDKQSGVSMAYEWMLAEHPALFTDEPTEDEYAVASPVTYDTYDLGDTDYRIEEFVDSLTKEERLCLEVLVRMPKFPTYRELGRAMSVSHTHAGKVLKQLQQKATCLQDQPRVV